MEKTKVLFVDDDIALGQVVILALRASGYAAEYCTTLVGIQGVVQEMQPDRKWQGRWMQVASLICESLSKWRSWWLTYAGTRHVFIRKDYPSECSI